MVLAPFPVMLKFSAAKAIDTGESVAVKKVISPQELPNH